MYALERIDPHAASKSVSSIKVVSMAIKKISHECRDAVIAVLMDKKVYMCRHEAVGDDANESRGSLEKFLSI